MKRNSFFVLFVSAMLTVSSVWAADDIRELPDPYPGAQECWQSVKKPLFVWGSIDVRYSRSQVPAAERIPDLYAWKGERVGAQAVFATPADVELTLAVSDLKNGRNVIPASDIRSYFVHYVMGDSYGDRSDSCLVADRLDATPTCAVPANTARPVWLDIRVPQDAAAGRYSGTVTVSWAEGTLSLPVRLTVADRVLPAPSEWAFHLDLWQNPYAVARYFNVPLWSKEHFDYMRPLMVQYAEAGAKVITASIIQHPWNSQTEDPFESMVVKMKNIDGTWSYNYNVLDKWIEFMMSCGVTEQIDLYTIVPWGYRFEYLDMATSTLKTFSCKPGEKAYEEYLLPFLTDLAKHMKAKGWFERTCIAMDERPMDQLRIARDLVRRADPGYRIAGAVNYSPEVVDLMYDISLGYRHYNLPDEVVEQRRNDKLVTTFYTCCSPDRPNTFLFSPPAESAFLGFHAAALGVDGYLRWALNSWVKDPCVDARFRTWYSGDCYLIYPTGSSIRFEQLVRGIQDYEKIRILRAEASPAGKKAIDALLKPFSPIKYADDTNAAAEVRAAEAALRKVK